MDIITNLVNHSDGYKTIIIGLMMIAVGGYNQDNDLVLQGFGLIFLRMGIKKVDTNPKELRAEEKQKVDRQ